MDTLRLAQQAGRLIFDVGMHQGEDTEYYLKKGFHVVAFEADPDLTEACRRKLATEIEDNRLLIVEGAILEDCSACKGTGKVKFYKNIENSVWGTVVGDWACRNESLGSASRVIEVNAVDFGACLDRYGIPYYMKIDIEGADRACLEALRGFSAKPRFVSLESEKVEFRKLEEELALLEELGYNAFQAVQQENIGEQVSPNPPREGAYALHTFPEGASGLFGKELPGIWRSKRELLREYRRIFALYRLFGDHSFLRRSGLGHRMIGLVSSVTRRPIPGWYDTHARHSSNA